jgi:hypothetical protein
MRSFRPARIFRLTLAISVSLWMAGAGCLLGCSNVVHASPQDSNDDVNTVVADDSCSAKHSHDCCAKKKQPLEARGSQFKVETVAGATPAVPVPGIKAGPGSMKDCPLAINASAVVSKARSDGYDESIARDNSSFVVPETSNTFSLTRSSESLLLNRGPTYLRCCVFLI